MTETDFKINNIVAQISSFFKAQARNQLIQPRPLLFKTEYKTALKVIDAEKNVFGADETFLNAYRDIYTDKAYKTIQLQNWQFELHFIGRQCSRISLLSDSVVFVNNKNIRKEIKNCNFKITIAEGETEVKKLPDEINGYLRRLGKKSLCNLSQNAKKIETRSLMSFAAVNDKIIPTFNYKPWASADSEYLDPMSVINNEGKKVLEKLRHFITRQKINGFMLQQGASQTTIQQLKKIVAAGK